MRAAAITFALVTVALYAILSFLVAGALVFPLDLVAVLLLAIVMNAALIAAAFVHVALRNDLSSHQRIVWLLLVLLVTPVVALGAIAYFALGKRRTRELFQDLGQTASHHRGSKPQ